MACNPLLLNIRPNLASAIKNFCDIPFLLFQIHKYAILNGVKTALSTLIFLFLASGCGKFQEKFSRLHSDRTTLQITTSGSQDGFHTTAQELWGRAMLVVVGQNGLQFQKGMIVPDKTQPLTLNLPNGNYKIYAVGWDGYFGGACANPTNCYPVEGQAYCSNPNGTDVSLNGITTSLNVVLTTGGCDFANSTVYTGGQAATTTIKPTNIKVCSSGSSLPTCSAPGASHDVQMELLEYELVGGNLTIFEDKNLSHACSSAVNDTGSGTSKNPVVGFPFLSRVRLYTSGSSCASGLSKTYLFTQGLSGYATSPGSANTYFNYYNAGSGSTQLMLRE